MKLIVFFCALVSMAGFAHAQAEEDTRAVVFELPEVADVTPETVDVVYDPKELPDEKTAVSRETLANETAAMTTEEYARRLQTEVVIPESTRDAAKLSNLDGLADEDQQKFFAKKRRFLERTAKFLTTIRLKPPTVNKVVHQLNEEFFSRARVIANANTSVTTVSLGGALGVGLSDLIVNQLRKISLLKNLPDRAGFYLLFSVGVSVVRTQVNGKTKLRIEPIFEFRNATRIFSPFAYITGGFIFGHSWENRQAGQSSLQQAQFIKASILNMTTGADQFGINMAAGAAFPPGGGAVAGFEGNAYRFRLSAKAIPEIYRFLKSYLMPHAKLSCTAVW